MTIEFKDITTENWKECIMLTTNTDGKHTLLEAFVASNAVSIAQSKIQEGWIIKAVYADVMVGFVMYGYSEDDSCYELCRLMIDHKYQGRGYGKRSLLKVIDEMKKIEGCNEIFLSFDPDNHGAQKLYESVGFVDTGELSGSEKVYVYKIMHA